MSLAAPDLVTQPSRAARLASPLATAAVVGLGTVALNLRDPHASGAWGYCPTALIGFDCPLCGSLRAVNDLTHVDLVAAASSNLVLVLAVPVVIALWGRRVVALWRGGAATKPVHVRSATWVALLIGLTLFTVLRNLPVGAWLAS